MLSRRYAVIVGARPNFIKAAAFFAEARKRRSPELFLIHTGQHHDAALSDVFFHELGLPVPAIRLEVEGEYHTERIGRMFATLTDALSRLPAVDGVIVFGDVNSSLAGALAAAGNRLPMIHVEAGLRSHDRRMPEEINRVIIDHLSARLFTSEEDGYDNLIKEGINKDKITRAGNLMVQSLELFNDQIQSSNTSSNLDVKEDHYVVATIHRQENTDDPEILKQVFLAFSKLSSWLPVVIPLHPGTKAKLCAYDLVSVLDDLVVTGPMGYFQFINLVRRSRGVVTDSGGIQEETTHLGIPCCTLRDNTERPVTLQLGSNRLFPPATVGRSLEDMIAHLSRTDFRSRHIPLWDDRVAQRILDAL